MKYSFRHLRSFTIGVSAASLSLITTPFARAASGTWSGAAADNVYNNGLNWGGATAADFPTNSETATWNGTQAGSLSILWNAQVSGFGQSGVNLVLTSAQTGSLSLTNTANGNSFGIDSITIQAGAGAFTLGGNTGTPTVALRSNYNAPPRNSTWINNSSNTATIGANVAFVSGEGAARSLTFDGSGNWQADAALATPNGGALTIVKNGAGTLTVTNTNTSQNNGYTVNAGTLAVGGSGRLGGPAGVFSGTLVNNGTLAYNSTASQTIASSISGTGALTQSSGNLTLNGSNIYSGATTVSGGTLILGADGAINSSSGISVNGTTAKFVQTSSAASTVAIALTQGTLDGTGAVGHVTVGNGTGGIITHGNGGTSALTIDSLTFGGASTINIAEDGISNTSAIQVTGALVTTPANGLVTINASQTSWTSGTTFDLLSFGSFSGSIANFTKGSITGLSIRQSASLKLNGSAIALQIAGDNPEWTGKDNGNWVVGSTGALGNWKLITGGTSTNYIQGDTVLFGNSATGGTNIIVNISAASVSPALVTFDNTAKNYTVSSGGGFGIASGSLIKKGFGSLTISTNNTYTGGTTVDAGTLTLSGAGTLGAATSPLTIGEGILNLGVTSQTVGAVTINGAGTISGGTLTPASVTANVGSSGLAEISSVIAGSGSVKMNGLGILTLSGANTYTGGTTVNSGVVTISGSGKLGSTADALTLDAGALDLGGTSQTVGAASLTGAATILNGTLTASSFNDSHTVGTAIVSANLAGTSGLTQSGAGGTLVLTGANTYTGTTAISSGAILQVGDGGTVGSLSPSSTILIGNGGRFAINRSDAVTQGVDFGLIDGVLGGVNLTGSGTTTFNMANTYTGPTNISAGTVIVTNSGGLGTAASGALNIGVGLGSLHLSGDITLPHAITARGDLNVSDTAGALVSSGNNTLSGAINFGNPGGTYLNIVSTSGTLTVGGNLSTTQAAPRAFNFGGAGNVIVTGVISDNTSPGAVSKTGAGTLTLLAATNTYTGATTITNGTLRVIGSIATSSGVSFTGTGGTLAGTGTVSAVTLTSGNFIAPGDGTIPIGTLSAASLTLNGGGFIFDLNPGNTSDLIALTGALTDAGTGYTFTLYGGAVGETYTLISFGSTNFVNASEFTAAVGGSQGTFAFNGNTLTFTATTIAVPEPSTAALVLGGLVTAFIFRRRLRIL